MPDKITEVSARIDAARGALVIELPLDETGKVSGSGKSQVHATTNGNLPTSAKVAGKTLIIGVNAYTKL